MTVRTITKYQANADSIHKIILTNETAAVAGAPPAGDIDSNVPAKVSKSNGEYGVRPRGLRLTRVLGTGATASRRNRFLPILTETAWNAFAEGAELTVGGVQWTISKKINEDL